MCTNTESNPQDTTQFSGGLHFSGRLHSKPDMSTATATSTVFSSLKEFKLNAFGRLEWDKLLGHRLS